MNQSDTPQGPKRLSSRLLFTAFIVLLLGAAAAFWGITTRARALADVTRETRETAVPTVAVVTPERTATSTDIALPGTMQPFTEAPIYARTSGYLRKWYADIGTRVRAGQLLADIDTPEVDQQLQQARADLGTADANAKLALATAERFRDLSRKQLVSQQDVDNANGSYDAKQAAVESARANVKRLEELKGFNQLRAPFAGVITARNVDVGALIGSNGKELFHIAATDKLRVFVNVPEVYSRAAQPGIKADLTLKEFTGRKFTGVLVRTSQSIEVASRTLLTEVDVDNPKGELLPGSYAEVHLKLPTPATLLKLPVSAIIFKADGLQIAKVAEGRVSLASVTLGRDFGNSVEVITGLNSDDQVVANPGDSLKDGETVRVVKGD
jgi:RND family efflux transporter MFP subunit